jgi:site-specific recombinase XerD
MSIAAELQHLQLALGALAPDVDWGWLRQWQYAYQKRARPRDKRGKIVDPRLLLDLGCALMDSAEESAHTSERARQFRDGLVIALLVSRPLRRRSFGALEIGRNLHFKAGRYVIELQEHDTKAGHPVCFDVPDGLTSYMTRYLETYRPLFSGARTSKALWLSAKGGRLGEDALYDLVCRRTREAFGFAIHPHLFRDIAATAIAREVPGSMLTARDLLTHAKLETTQQFYTQARTADAARTYAEVVARLRSASPRREA